MNTPFQVYLLVDSYLLHAPVSMLHLYHAGPRRGWPSRGTPNHLIASNSHTARIDPYLIPLPEEAVRQYEQAGGHITHFSGFGEDPLVNVILSHQHEAKFHQRYPNFEPFFTNW